MSMWVHRTCYLSLVVPGLALTTLLIGLGSSFASPAPQTTVLEVVKVVASSTHASPNDAFGTHHLFDGDFTSSSRWVSDGKMPQSWVAFDLGKPYALSQITLFHAGASGQPGAENTRDFDVQTGTSLSPYDSEWSTVGSVRGNQAESTEVSVTGTSTRYLRVMILDAGAGNHARIREVQIYGGPQMSRAVNVAPLARLVSASSVLPSKGNKYVASRVRDNDVGLSSRWISDGRTEESWLAFDLGAHYDVSRVTIFHAGSATELMVHNTRDFDLQVAAAWSPHNGAWKSVERVRDNTSHKTTIHIGRRTRFLRVKILDAGIDDHARIAEVVIHGARAES